ncbi:group-specific protein [Bacillus cereus]|nr:group-specific protein [Bacillus cereus]
MSNLGTDLSDSRLIVVKVKEKEYQFIVREHPIVGGIISLLENGKEYGLINKQR